MVDLIQKMKTTQRDLNKLWRNLTATPKQRWNTMSKIFEVEIND